MATWEDLRAYIASKYEIESERPKSVKMWFNMDEGRRQSIVVGEVGDDWGSILTKVAQEEQVNLRDLLVRNSEMTIGSLSLAEDGGVMLEQSFPLEILAPHAFEVMLHTMLLTADELERELTGEDKY